MPLGCKEFRIKNSEFVLKTQFLFHFRSLLLELKRLKDVQHDNIVRFVGACLEPGGNPQQSFFK